MEINEVFVKFSGKETIPTETPVQLGQDMAFEVKGTVVKIEEADTQEGTKDVTYVVKVTEIKQ